MSEVAKGFVKDISVAIRLYNASDSLWQYQAGRIPLEVKKFVCHKYSLPIENFDLWAQRYCEMDGALNDN